MKGWMVHDVESHVYVRASTRGRAKRFWPGETEFIGIHVLRAAWLDGGTKEQEVDAVYVPCPGIEEIDGHDAWEPCPYHCAEGEIVSRELTLQALGEA